MGVVDGCMIFCEKITYGMREREKGGFSEGFGVGLNRSCGMWIPKSQG